jgi:hypothetical protein
VRLAQERLTQERLEMEGAAQEGLKQLIKAAAEAAAKETADVFLAGIRQQIDSLPKQLAKAVPEAVRTHDEAEALRLRTDGHESALEQLVARAATCTELGKIDGLNFDPVANVICCDDCNRYATSNQVPNILLRGCGNAAGVGTFEGPRPRGHPHGVRAMFTVRAKIAKHLRPGNTIHNWCNIHAYEVAQHDRKQDAIAMLCSRLVLQGVKVHACKPSLCTHVQRRTPPLWHLCATPHTPVESSTRARALAITRARALAITRAITRNRTRNHPQSHAQSPAIAQSPGN